MMFKIEFYFYMFLLLTLYVNYDSLHIIVYNISTIQVKIFPKSRRSKSENEKIIPKAACYDRKQGT